MKKLTTAIALCVSLFALLFANSCRKQTNAINTGTDSNQLLIQTAMSYMQAQHFPDNPTTPGDTLTYSRASLHKTPLWNQAQVQTFSFGKGVVVPIQVQEPLAIQVGGKVYSANQITWLFMYPDPSAAWHIEVVTRIPSDSSGSSLPGKVRVEDWSGNFLKGYLYTSNSHLAYATSQTIIQPGGIAPLLEAPPSTDCTITDWYACGTIGDGPAVCDYEYSTEECSASTDDGGGDGGSLPTSTDYGNVGGSGAGSTGSNSAAPQGANITPDTTITNNPNVACVWNHLMNPNLTNGLRSVLSGFFGPNYNVTFSLSDNLQSDGMCKYLGTNSFQILINANDANDPDYSRIYLASAFIHEAFHAMLRQQALATFGEETINQWPTSIDNMTLAQLATYFENESQTLNVWESVEHDWMVDNVATLAGTLQSFVQTYYTSTYATVGSSILPYEALMYLGLQVSPLYTEQVVKTGLSAQFQTYCGELNEGGKCTD